MTVTFDSVSNLGTAITTAGLSATYTVGGSATALCVAVGGANVTWASLTTHTVTVGGTPLTLLGFVNNANVASDGWTALWGLIGPATGAQTVAVIANSGSTPAFINVTAISFNGASQFGTCVTNFGTSTVASAVTSGGVVSSTGCRVLTIAGAYDATLTLTGSGTQRSDMPASPSTSFVTLLVQDQAGAATVTNTATYAGTHGWGVLSVNIVAGSRWTGAANASMGLASIASASFVGAVWSGSGAASMSLAATASATVTPLGPALRYVGRQPDTTGVIATAAYVQREQNAFLVTPSWVTQQITLAADNLVTETYIDEAVANYATETQVNNALANYVPTSALGSTVGQLGSDGNVPSGVLPSVTTNSVGVSYDVTGPQGVVWLPPDQQFQTATSNLGELKIGTIDIPDPGYPYVVFPFAYVQAWSGSSPSGNSLMGNGNVGIMTVTPTGETTPVYAAGLCTADTVGNYYSCIPCAITVGPVTPSTNPPITGSISLELSACNWTGTGYTFSGTGLVFFCIVVPGLSGA